MAVCSLPGQTHGTPPVSQKKNMGFVFFHLFGKDSSGNGPHLAKGCTLLLALWMCHRCGTNANNTHDANIVALKYLGTHSKHIVRDGDQSLLPANL